MCTCLRRARSSPRRTRIVSLPPESRNWSDTKNTRHKLHISPHHIGHRRLYPLHNPCCTCSRQYAHYQYHSWWKNHHMYCSPRFRPTLCVFPEHTPHTLALLVQVVAFQLDIHKHQYVLKMREMCGGLGNLCTLIGPLHLDTRQLHIRHMPWQSCVRTCQQDTRHNAALTARLLDIFQQHRQCT